MVQDVKIAPERMIVLLRNKLFAVIALVLAISCVLSACSLIANKNHSDTLPSEATINSEDNNLITSTALPETTTVPETTDSQSPDYVSSFNVDTMSLEEKVAQMILVSCHEDVDVIDAITKGVGGLCLYAFSFEDKNKYEVIDMTSYYQSIANVPLIISTDEEGGDVNRVSINDNLRAVPFWAPADLFEYGGWELVKSDTEEKSDLLLSLGINVNLAPVCDVPLSEDNYIYSRTFGMDANNTAAYVALVVSTMKEKGIGSTLKHFPGYGGSVDTHENVAYDTRDYSAFENGDFIPFQHGISSGADSVLVSHNIVTCMDAEMPASLSKPVHDILRNDLGFDGVVMTDDLVMEAITQFTDGESAATYAVLAGNDMLCCENYDEAIKSIVNAVNEGVISEAQIDDSVNRILKWKSDLNLL